MSAGQLVMIAGLASALLAVGWRSVYVWLGSRTSCCCRCCFEVARDSGSTAAAAGRHRGAVAHGGHTDAKVLAAAGGYGICGLDDFFVSTHVVALAQDRGVDTLLAGNLLGADGADRDARRAVAGVGC